MICKTDIPIGNRQNSELLTHSKLTKKKKLKKINQTRYFSKSNQIRMNWTNCYVQNEKNKTKKPMFVLPLSRATFRYDFKKFSFSYFVCLFGCPFSSAFKSQFNSLSILISYIYVIWESVMSDEWLTWTHGLHSSVQTHRICPAKHCIAQRHLVEHTHTTHTHTTKPYQNEFEYTTIETIQFCLTSLYLYSPYIPITILTIK